MVFSSETAADAADGFGHAADLFVTVMAIRVEFRTRRIQETLTADSGKNGMLMKTITGWAASCTSNPDDSRLLINARVGINTTFNMAKTSGKVFSVMVVLLLLAMPFTGMFLHALDRQPLTLALTETTLIAHRGSKSELIDRADINEVELLLELPENMTRSWGECAGSSDGGPLRAGRGEHATQSGSHSAALSAGDPNKRTEIPHRLPRARPDGGDSSQPQPVSHAARGQSWVHFQRKLCTESAPTVYRILHSDDDIVNRMEGGQE